MDHILAEKLDVFATVYLEDILMFLKNKQDHAEHLCWMLSKLREDKLKAKLKKSAFGLAEVQWLGYIVKNSTISMAHKKSTRLPNGLHPIHSKNHRHFSVYACCSGPQGSNG